MIQFTFFALFSIAMLSWAFIYFTSDKPVDPMKIAMEDSGYRSVEMQNRKKFEELHILTEQGLTKIRGKIERLTWEQRQLQDAIKQRQEALKATYQQVNSLIKEAQRHGNARDKDVLQLKAAVMSIEDQQRLLIARGRQLGVMNDRLIWNRQRIADQMNAGKVSGLQEQLHALNEQAEKAKWAMQKVRDQMQALKDRAAGIADTRQMVKDRMELMKQQRQQQKDEQEMMKQRVEDQRQMLEDRREHP